MNAKNLSTQLNGLFRALWLGLLSICIFILPLLGTMRGYAQAPDYLWAKSAGGTDPDVGRSVSTDDSGNIFITGYFASSSITFGTTTLTNSSAGYMEFLIVKYDPSGNVLWAKSAQGSSNEEGYCVSTDYEGNILVTGFFSSPSLTFGTTTLTNAGGADIFIVKYDPSGNVLWAKSAGGFASERGYSISTDAGGNILVTGYFGSSPLTFGTTDLTNAGGADIFIVKYDPSGNVLWAKSTGGASSDWGSSVSADLDANILVTGFFYSSSITFGTTTLTNVGGADIFIAKYDSSGNVLWAKSTGGTSNDFGNSTATDADRNIIITGDFYSSSITFGSTTLTNAGLRDIFIVKYDSTGNVLWAKSAGGTGTDYGYGVSDASGNIIVAGPFNSPSITFGTTTLTNSGLDDIFIAKYDSLGNVLWAKSAGGIASDWVFYISTDAIGNVFVIGEFESQSLTFGSTTLTNADITGNTSDMFIVKLGGFTGVNELSGEESNLLFPNPTGGKFQLAISPEYSGKLTIVELKIYNVLGEKVYYSTMKPLSHGTIDISNVPGGIYFIHLQTGHGIINKKLIINK